MDIILPYGDFTIPSLTAAISNSAEVCLLDLSGNNISPEMSITLVDVFISQMVNLVSLELRDNKMGPRGAEYLCNALRQHCPKLRNLDLNENGILNESLLHVAYLLRDNRIESLSLVANHLTPLGMATLCDGLISSRYIRELALGFNALGDAGASEIAKALSDHSSLQSLDISDNGIGDEGAVDIATHLIMSPKSRLISLNLSVNRIGDIGIAAIAEALAYTTNPRLKKLDLGCNTSIGEKGRCALINHMSSMRHLHSIDLCSFNLTNENMQKITEAVSNNTCGITSVEWYNNPEVNTESEKALYDLLVKKKDILLLNEAQCHCLKITTGVVCAAAIVSGIATLLHRYRR